MASNTAPKKAQHKASKPAAPKAHAGVAVSEKRQHDWERIETDYRAGIKSLREMADEHGITEGAIRKRAKRDGWTRDLSAKIQAKADELVRKEAVRSEVRAERAATEREIVEANAEAIVMVRMAQRKDIQRGRSVVMRLFDELELQAGPENVALLEELGELLRAPDEKGQDKRNDLYQKIISLPGRAKTMKDLGESLRVLVSMERQAFGLDGDLGEEGGDKSFLEALLNARARAANR